MSLALRPTVSWHRSLIRLPGWLTGWLAGRLAAEGERRFALWLPVAMGCGILLYFQLASEPPAWWGWAAPTPLALAAACFLRGARPPGWALLLAGALGLGFALAQWAAARAAPPLDLPRTAVVVTGTVTEVDPLPEGGLRLTLRGATWREGVAPAARDIRVRLRAGGAARPVPGDVVRLRALLRPPSPPAYPGAWDFQRDAFFSGLGAFGFALGPVEIVAREAGQRASAPALAATRAAIEARVMEVVPGAAGAIAAALLTGGQSGIAPAEMAAMRDSGLAHLLSVSGLHVAIVMGVTVFTARALLALLLPRVVARFGSKPWAMLAGLAASGFYMVLTGSQVPMQRSFAMAAAVTVAIIAGRRALSPWAWAMAAGVVMAIQPAAILGPSFQMSFAAVLALIAAYGALRPWLMRKDWPPWATLLLGTVLTSLVAGAATMPAGLHHFGRLQLYGVAANAVAVPITSFVVMPAGMAAMVLMPLGLETWPLRLMGWGVEAVLWVARTVASWPGAALGAVPLPAWGLACCALGLLWLCLWQTSWRLAGVPVLALGLVSGGPGPLPDALPDALVSADGRLLALRAGGGFFVERRPGAQRFTQEIWLRGAGLSEAAALPLDGEAAGGRIRCEPRLCVLRDAAGQPLVALLRPAPAPPAPRGAARVPDRTGADRAGADRGGADRGGADRGGADRAGADRAWADRRGGELRPSASEPACGAAPVLLSPEPVRGRCPGSAVVDRFSVWRDGAHAVFAQHGEVRVVSDRAHRGDRPWVPPRPLPRATSDEPPAQTE